MDTLLLSQNDWDLVVDAAGNIAVASDPYSQAQDAASAIRTFQGEVYFDTTLGVPYLPGILGKFVNLAHLKAQFVSAALAVPGVTAAVCFISAFANRTVSGQVKITSATGQQSTAAFATPPVPTPTPQPPATQAFVLGRSELGGPDVLV